MGLREGDKAMSCHVTSRRGGGTPQLLGDLPAIFTLIERQLHLVALLVGESAINKESARTYRNMFR